MNRPLFNAAEFGRIVKSAMDRERYSCRELAKITGVSHATINRVTNGNPPSVEAYLRLTWWMNGNRKD